jgi:hypothetical protein
MRYWAVGRDYTVYKDVVVSAPTYAEALKIAEKQRANPRNAPSKVTKQLQGITNNYRAIANGKISPKR